MSALAPDLFDRRYADLVRIGRAKLPGIAPEWTDYNAHDPGITLIELLAWSAEAQIYSLSRVRRDERAAYAALMGIGSHGTRPAQGLIWPDPSDPDGPSQTRKHGGVIEADAAIQMARSEGPTFHTGRRLLWIPARIELLQTRLPDGTSVDLTMANRRGGPAFQPFGYGDGRGAVLRMALVAPAGTPLLEAGRPRNAMLAIGVRVDSSRTEPATRPAIRPAPAPTLEVQLVTDDAIFALPIVEDSTRGLLQTGALLLDLAAVDAQPTTAILEFRMPNGTPRAPQLLRIEPNVLPVRQRAAIRECHDANGLPDQQFDLQVPGIAFEPGNAPVAIEVELLGTETAWIQCERLADHGPLDWCLRSIRSPPGLHSVTVSTVRSHPPKLRSSPTIRRAMAQGATWPPTANGKWMALTAHSASTPIRLSAAQTGPNQLSCELRRELCSAKNMP